MTDLNYTNLATDKSIELAIKNLIKNNFNAEVVNSKKEAIDRVLDLIPKGSEVMTASSTTLIQLGLDTKLNDSTDYNSVKSQLTKLNRETDSLQMQKLGAAPEYIIGSVHAVTEDGKVLVASGSGSQLPGYSYGAPHVIWVVSTKKIVKNLEEGIKRINEHVLPLEDIRMKGVYGPDAGSKVRKLLIFNEELNPDRIKIIFVKDDLGF